MEKVDAFPQRSGVYVMKDATGEVLYVGKAKNLRERAKSYFSGRSPANRDPRPLVKFLLEKVSDMNCIVTDTEKEALILEDTLIKKYRPRYNVRFRDDKTYVNLRLTVKDDFPRLHVVRRPKRDGSMIFGPYPSSQAVRETLRLVQKIFPLRSCTDRDLRTRTRPCIQYQIKQCSAPCVGYVNKEQYGETVREVILFLQGRNRALLDSLREKMKSAAEREDYEEAARLRDLISSIEKTLERQKVILQDDRDSDIFALNRDLRTVSIQVLNMRKGILLGGRNYILHNVILPDEEALSSFIRQYYETRENVIPDLIVLPFVVEEEDALEEVLGEIKGGTVRFKVPRRGELHKLVKMAEQNAGASLKVMRSKEENLAGVLKSVQERLGLRNSPRSIEAYDISNISGTLAVGSLVTFEDGEPLKDGYKRFRIRHVEGADDYGMMYEVLTRRFGHYDRSKSPPLEDQTGRDDEKWGLPDLIIVDGGKGQLNVVLAVLKEQGENIDVIGLAKGEPDKIYVPHVKDPVSLHEGSPELLFLQRIRDEAHRFAISYHIKLRSTRDLHSALDDIPGIGEERKKELLRRFSSVERIKEAAIEEISSVPKIGLDLAQEIYRRFHPA